MKQQSPELQASDESLSRVLGLLGQIKEELEGSCSRLLEAAKTAEPVGIFNGKRYTPEGEAGDAIGGMWNDMEFPSIVELIQDCIDQDWTKTALKYLTEERDFAKKFGVMKIQNVNGKISEAILIGETLVVDGAPRTPDDVRDWHVIEAPFEKFRALGFAGFMMAASEDLARRWMCNQVNA